MGGCKCQKNSRRLMADKWFVCWNIVAIMWCVLKAVTTSWLRKEGSPCLFQCMQVETSRRAHLATSLKMPVSVTTSFANFFEFQSRDNFDFETTNG